MGISVDNQLMVLVEIVIRFLSLSDGENSYVRLPEKTTD